MLSRTRLLTTCVFLAFSTATNIASAQAPAATQQAPTAAPPTAAAPPAAGAADSQYQKNLEATERLSKYFESLKDVIGKSNQAAQGQLRDFNDAEKAVEEILKNIKEGIELGSPDGEFQKLIDSFIDAAAAGANQAQAKQSEDLAKEFVKRKTEFEDTKKRMAKAYTEYLNMNRIVSARKDDLALAKRLNSLRAASEIIQKAADAYVGAQPLFKEIFDSFPKPLTTPTQ